jgi:TatA/E family protein of Tat protein translocase
MTLFGIGPMELMVILVLALIIFGPDRLPEILRTIGKAVNEFRKTSEEVTSTVMREVNNPVQQAKDKVPTPKSLSASIQQSVMQTVTGQDTKPQEAAPKPAAVSEPAREEPTPQPAPEAPVATAPAQEEPVPEVAPETPEES